MDKLVYEKSVSTDMGDWRVFCIHKTFLDECKDILKEESVSFREENFFDDPVFGFIKTRKNLLQIFFGEFFQNYRQQDLSWHLGL